MGSKSHWDLLRKRLRTEVSHFYQRDRRLWKEPVVEMLRTLQRANVDAVFFGGTLRSLLVSRVRDGKPGRPRDVDIVISGESVEAVRSLVQDKVERETRFGGLQVKEREWQFDLWPVERTWAFVNDNESVRGFSALPQTTFFNMEAIAVEVWPRPGKPRRIYSGDDQFFDGLTKRMLEINREDNPFPGLCVVRALIMAWSLEFSIGPRLARYIVTHGGVMGTQDLMEVQESHYGYERVKAAQLHNWIGFICDSYEADPAKAVRLPLLRQLEFWPRPDPFGGISIQVLSEVGA